MSKWEFAKLYAKAHEAGCKAGDAHVPQPMYIRGYAPIADGLCGIAWINVKPGTSAFARWLKATGKARTDSYEGGVCIWVTDYNQSFAKKRAYANAFAQVLQEAGIRAMANARLD